MSIDVITGIIRHLLTFGGGFLITKGVADSSTIDNGVGALITLIGVVWSIIHKLNLPKQTP